MAEIRVEGMQAKAEGRKQRKAQNSKGAFVRKSNARKQREGILGILRVKCWGNAGCDGDYGETVANCSVGLGDCGISAGGRGKREEGRGKREEGRGKREEGRGVNSAIMP